MPPLLARRLRGIAGTTLTWSIGGAVTGALLGAGISLGVMLPRGMALHLGELMLGVGIGGGIAGAITGLGFALLVTVSEGSRSVAELRSLRIGACGAIAAGVMAILISGNPVFAAACGVIGFAGASVSLAMARRASLSAPEPRPLLEG